MPASSDVISRWHHSVEGLSTSSLDFFTSIEGALKEKETPVQTERIQLGEGGILSAKRTYLRVSHDRFVFDIGAAPFGKDFFFSWWLGRRVSDSALMIGCVGVIALPLLFMLCYKIGGFFGGLTLFFLLLVGGVMYMQQGGRIGDVDIEDLMMSIPVIGPLYLRFFRPVTYYSEDTRKMFEETVHRVVLDVVAGVLAVNNMKPLTPEEAKPKGQKHRLIEAALGTE
jgi:hypothetical protein